MGALEQVNQMKSQGLQDSEITTKLQEQGISPLAINNALSQSQIKQAVTKTEDSTQNELQPMTRGKDFSQAPKTQEANQYAAPAQQAPAPQQNQPQYDAPPAQQEYYQEQPYDQDEYYQEQPYDSGQGGYTEEYDGYAQGGAMGGTDTLIEVAEQVFSEKAKEIKKEVRKISESKALSEVKLKQIEERIKRIEQVIDKLQMAILQKVGSYGNTLQSIRKEMAMMQDSFGKMSPSLAQKHAKHKPASKAKAAPKKKAVKRKLSR